MVMGVRKACRNMGKANKDVRKACKDVKKACIWQFVPLIYHL